MFEKEVCWIDVLFYLGRILTPFYTEYTTFWPPVSKVQQKMNMAGVTTL